MSEYTIQELSQLSGVPRRNIYFYTQQGILPPPQGAGLGARYSELHLLRLQAIPIFRNQGLRLDQIRERLLNMSPEEVRTLMQAPPQRTAVMEAAFPVPAVSSAITCIHYPLPGGVTLVVPETLSPQDRQKVERLRQAALQIWNEPSAPQVVAWRAPEPPSAESPDPDPDERN